VTTARLLISEDNKIDDQVFIVQQQFNQVRNAKKAAMLIKEFDLDLSMISDEFYHIEEIIVNDSMNFFLNQFGVSFKHYSMENTMRLADYLVDVGPQRYGKSLTYLIEKLHKHDILDEAKHLFDSNKSLVEHHLSDFIKSDLDKHEIELEIDPLEDSFGPVSKSSKSIEYFKLPNKFQVHVIENEE
jgi:hypothetical protein